MDSDWNNLVYHEDYIAGQEALFFSGNTQMNDPPGQLLKTRNLQRRC
jgi:hypothetical protein